MQLSRLSGRKTCDFVLRRGRVWKGKTMNIHWLPGSPKKLGYDAKKPALYVGTFASSRLSKSAVERNRMRRRCREALRLSVHDQGVSCTAQLLISPRFASLKASFELLLADVRLFLSLLSSSCPPTPPADRASSSMS
jgi:ribonuclease P protein component